MNAVLVQMDQLSMSSALLRERIAAETVVILVEDAAELAKLPFHKQRVAFVLSAMRHFAEELRAAGFEVVHSRVDQEPSEVIRRAANEIEFDVVTLMHAAEHGLDEAWHKCLSDTGIECVFVENDMFISNRLSEDFSFVRDKSVRMETFYRRMRKATGILMDGEVPVGGAWNFDKENRVPPSDRLRPPPPLGFTPDEITTQAIRDVKDFFPDHFGEVEPFTWPVTRKQALKSFRHFLQHRLAKFGRYQDAMVAGQDTLYHSLISACLNVGLLDPEYVCRETERYYEKHDIPLNSAEGFIRQILGWREFVYQLYRANMPGYDQRNTLNADLPLPSFYWDGNTKMRCIAESVRPVIERGMSHHIQRLMITGNFALIAGVDPLALNRWYWLGFVDAWHWVVTPNVIGMASYADGGLMATKPYAASANYIHKMSNYCKECAYHPKESVGDDACPFNALYWDFLARNQDRLSKNPRVSLSYRNLEKKSTNEVSALRKKAGSIRRRLRKGESV